MDVIILDIKLGYFSISGYSRYGDILDIKYHSRYQIEKRRVKGGSSLRLVLRSF